MRRKKASPEDRIVGTDVPPEIPPSEMPFVCSVRLQSVHRCCASILNPNWLLTSGQCTADLAPDAISIVCGIRMYRTVVEIALLPYYQPAASKPTANDLALLRVGRALSFTSNVQPIPLYDGVEVSTGTATLVRYGPMDERWSWWNSKLQLAEVSILSACECQYRLGPALAPYLEPRNICTDNGFVTTMPLTATGGPSSRCVGDSGAPVMFAASELQPYTLLAVTGWTVAPYGTGPSVHVRVAPHLDGILSIIGVN
ncbi:trypsin-3-like [Anopheles gambiae]|uniref:trypsin-3-like n=1 Tax=Anopheles gambiae TaxID=7165 RepID=UPI002AC92908|nr:trypsin-3-like [Anopheles gambiae]